MEYPGLQLQNMTKQDYDVVINGGGMVGATLALAFAQLQKSVLLIEQHSPSKTWLNQPPLRVSAINRFSENWLTSINCWSAIAASSKCQFKRLATWEQGSARVEFNAEEIGESHLGYLIRNEAIQIAAFDELVKTPNVDIIYQATLQQIDNKPEQVTVTLQQDGQSQTLASSLLIGADGANSLVRNMANIGINGWDYQQHCFSITIKTDFDQQDITWQQFQPSGPKAFLPLNDGYACLIWYDSPHKVAELKNLSDKELKQQIVDVFPELPGDFEIVTSASFPLTRRQANQYFSNRVVLVGDSAHTINPLAGQGVNLGFKDNAELIKVLSEIDLADQYALLQALKKYQLTRKVDSQIMSGTMDSFYQLFSNDKSVHKWTRGLLLSAANALPGIKKRVMKKALGF